MAAVGLQEGGYQVIQDQPQGRSIESTCFHGPNVVSCEVVIVPNVKWTQIIGA